MSAQLSRQNIDRQKRRRLIVVRRRRLRFGVALLLGFFAVTAYTVFSMVERSTAQVTGTELLVVDKPATGGPVDAAGPMYPVFARLDTRNLVLPVAAQAATIIAYHPLMDDRAVPLSPVGDQVNGGVLARTLKRVFSEASAVRYYMIEDKERNLSGTGCVDVGAPAGTPIVSPVSGVVTGVTEYSLYGKYPDVQIDIAPDGVGDVTISLLFVDEPNVTIGEVVVEGKTQLGKVRAPQGDLGEGLAEFTRDAGSHVHIQAISGIPGD